VLIAFQYEIQQDVGRVLIREPESRLLLAAPPIRRHAPGASILPATSHICSQLTFSTKDAIPTREPPIPFFTPCFCPNLPLVSASPIHTHISLWSRDDHRPLSSPCPHRSRLDAQWYLESRCPGPPRVCGRSCRMVHEGCLDERDGWQTHDSERCPGFTVRFSLFSCRVTDEYAVFRKRLFGDI